MKLELSVIICTHNPRADYLERVLKALKSQTCSFERWELLLIDNASVEKLSDYWDLKWHPNGRVIREDEVGLTAARLRGLREVQSELIIFVDDDNVLESDYLLKGLEVAKEWTELGAWGCQYFAEYDEGMPADWQHDIWSSKLDADVWSSLPDRAAAPFGGGMFLRASVAKEYLHKCSNEPLRRILDRSGSSLLSYGDFDMAFTACDIGLGIGRFKKLKLIHLISSKRTSKEYLWKIARDTAYSDIIFRYLRGEKPPKRMIQENAFFIYSIAREILKGKSVDILVAKELGRRKAIKFLRSNRS